MMKSTEHLLRAESLAEKAEELVPSGLKQAAIYAQLAIAHTQIAIAYKTIVG